jgi:hypothetical protein
MEQAGKYACLIYVPFYFQHPGGVLNKVVYTLAQYFQQGLQNLFFLNFCTTSQGNLPAPPQFPDETCTGQYASSLSRTRLSGMTSTVRIGLTKSGNASAGLFIKP